MKFKNLNFSSIIYLFFGTLISGYSISDVNAATISFDRMDSADTITVSPDNKTVFFIDNEGDIVNVSGSAGGLALWTAKVSLSEAERDLISEAAVFSLTWMDNDSIFLHHNVPDSSEEIETALVIPRETLQSASPGSTAVTLEIMHMASVNVTNGTYRSSWTSINAPTVKVEQDGGGVSNDIDWDIGSVPKPSTVATKWSVKARSTPEPTTLLGLLTFVGMGLLSSKKKVK